MFSEKKVNIVLSSPVRAIVLTTAPALVSVLALAMATWHCSNVKVFLSPYLLNMLMNQIDFLPDSRYWLDHHNPWSWT